MEFSKLCMYICRKCGSLFVCHTYILFIVKTPISKRLVYNCARNNFLISLGPSFKAITELHKSFDGCFQELMKGKVCWYLSKALNRHLDNKDQN
jgi:hypothetical protein